MLPAASERLIPCSCAFVIRHRCDFCCVCYALREQTTAIAIMCASSTLSQQARADHSCFPSFFNVLSMMELEASLAAGPSMSWKR